MSIIVHNTADPIAGLPKPGTCGTCRYFSRLTETPVSFGVCIWFEAHTIPPMPIWARNNVSTLHGSLSPNLAGCCTHESGHGPKEPK